MILANLGDSAVEWKVRAWVASADYFPVQEALTGAVKEELDAARIGIPFPQLQIHLPEDPTEASVSLSAPTMQAGLGASTGNGRTRPRARGNTVDSKPYAA